MEKMTVGDLMQMGVEEVDAFCASCGFMWRARIGSPTAS